MSVVAKRSPISATAELMYFFANASASAVYPSHPQRNPQNSRILHVLKSPHPQIRILPMAVVT